MGCGNITEFEMRIGMYKSLRRSIDAVVIKLDDQNIAIKRTKVMRYNLSSKWIINSSLSIYHRKRHLKLDCFRFRQQVVYSVVLFPQKLLQFLLLGLLL